MNSSLSEIWHEQRIAANWGAEGAQVYELQERVLKKVLATLQERGIIKIETGERISAKLLKKISEDKKRLVEEIIREAIREL